MAFKALIFLALVAVAWGFTLPEDNQFDDAYAEPEWGYDNGELHGDNIALIRMARSPQGSMSANVEHSRQMGTSAGVDYNRQISKNLEAYVGASRNFKFNDNSGHAGLRYRF